MTKGDNYPFSAIMVHMIAILMTVTSFDLSQSWSSNIESVQKGSLETAGYEWPLVGECIQFMPLS